MAAHIAHCRATATLLGDLISKDKRGSLERVDAAIAAILAHDRAAWHTTNSIKRRTVSFR